MSIKQMIVSGALGVALVPALFQEAKSDTFPAWGGKAQVLAQQSCFVPHAMTGVMNTCNSLNDWFIPFTNRFGAGSRTFEATGEAPFMFEVEAQCQAFSVLADNSNFWASAMLPIGPTGSVVLGTTTTTATSIFEFRCRLDGGNLGLGLFSVRVI